VTVSVQFWFRTGPRNWGSRLENARQDRRILVLNAQTAIGSKPIVQTPDTDTLLKFLIQSGLPLHLPKCQRSVGLDREKHYLRHFEGKFGTYFERLPAPLGVDDLRNSP